MLLEFKHVDTHYGDLHVLKDVNYAIDEGEIIALLGGNACGKSTTMKTIMGVVRPTRGQVIYQGKPIERLPTAERVRRGIAPVLEARRLFPRMTVFENLEMGAYLRKRGAEFDQDLERVYALFPRVKERRNQIAGTLSGGEQQMVAMGRALMARPKLLCMDEPSMGLAPIFVEQVFDIIQEINRQGTTIFMVEQNANMALSIAHRAYVLQTGQVVLSGTAAELRQNPMIREAYLGEMQVAVVGSTGEHVGASALAVPQAVAIDARTIADYAGGRAVAMRCRHEHSYIGLRIMAVSVPHVASARAADPLQPRPAAHAVARAVLHRAGTRLLPRRGHRPDVPLLRSRAADRRGSGGRRHRCRRHRADRRLLQPRGEGHAEGDRRRPCTSRRAMKAPRSWCRTRRSTPA